MNKTVKTLLFWLVIGVSALLLWETVKTPSASKRSAEINYSRFMSEVEAGHVVSVAINGTEIQGSYRDGGLFRLNGPSDPGAYLDKLRDKSVEIRFSDPSSNSLPGQLLATWVPLILLGAVWFLMIGQMRRRQGGPPPGTDPSAPINPK